MCKWRKKRQIRVTHTRSFQILTFEPVGCFALIRIFPINVIFYVAYLIPYKRLNYENSAKPLCHRFLSGIELLHLLSANYLKYIRRVSLKNESYKKSWPVVILRIYKLSMKYYYRSCSFAWHILRNGLWLSSSKREVNIGERLCCRCLLSRLIRQRARTDKMWANEMRDT